MTDHNEGAALCIAGRPVAAYLRARVPSLTRRVVDRLRLFADVIERREPHE